MSSSKNEVQYLEFSNKRTNTTIWNHFLRANDGQSAKCKLCHKVLKTAGGATTGLHTHVRAVHSNINISNTVVDNSDSSSSLTDITPGTSKEKQLANQAIGTKKRKLVMTDFFIASQTIEVIVSRMAALDGCSFRFFTESQDLRQLFNKSGYELPRSPNTIAKMVLTQAEEVKTETKNKIVALKIAGHRFTLSLDEWTSLRNKRYMNINLHSKGFGGFNFKNLGLVKITGSMPALTAFNMLRDHLAKFNVSLEDDVVSQTTDGASVMVKMGTYCKGHHQLCLAHGIQLAIIDTLYKTNKEPESAIVSIQHASDSDDDCEPESDENEVSARNEDCFEIEIPTVRADPRFYKEIIVKVRSLIKLIRKSPLKADALRVYVLKEHGKDIQLQLDCQTRWSSMSDMIGVFLKIKGSVLKALIDWKSEISFAEDEIITLTEVYRSLNVVKLTVLSLCQRDATLYTADRALKFVLKKLDEQNSFLSSLLATNLRSRIKQRRLLLASVLHYLHDSEDFFAQSDDDTFPKPNGEEITDIITNLLRQLKYKEITTEPSSFNPTPADPAVPFGSLIHVLSSSNDEILVDEPTLQEQLDEELCKCKESRRKLSTNFDLAGFVKVEKAMYDNGGDRDVYLTEAYKYISCVLPTSVESERVFSCAGYFCNRIRSSLSDKMLDALLFLRTHYQEQRFLSKK